MTASTVHVVAGILGIGFGFVALYAVKGAKLHRKSGMLFVYAMLTMSVLGAAMAAVLNVQPASNVPVGLLTAYLVVTALVTVRPPARGSRWLDLGLFLVALGVGLTLLTFGLETVASASGKRDGVPPFPFFVFGGVALLASAGDVRMMRSGGVQILRGARRLTRHLWRIVSRSPLPRFPAWAGSNSFRCRSGSPLWSPFRSWCSRPCRTGCGACASNGPRPTSRSHRPFWSTRDSHEKRLTCCFIAADKRRLSS